jgi:hypothetical protein
VGLLSKERTYYPSMQGMAAAHNLPALGVPPRLHGQAPNWIPALGATRESLPREMS